jgi:hypothetical protein
MRIKANTKPGKRKWVGIPFMSWVFAYRSSIIVVVYRTENEGVRREKGI